MSGSNGLIDSLAHPAQINLMDAYGRAASTANSIWENRLFQAKQAAGQAALGAIDPATGQFSAPKLNQNLAADPNTALSAQESMQRGSTNATTDFDLNMKRLTGLNAAAMALTAQYPNGVPQAAVHAEIDRVGPIYGLTPQQMAQAKSGFGPDPVANSRTIIRNGVSNLSAQESLHASRPGPATVDMGPAVVGANVAPAAADQPGALTVPPGQGVGKATDPNTNAALVEVSDGQGNKYKVPRSSLPNASGAAGGGATRPVVDYTGKPNPLLGDLPNPPEGGAAAQPATPATPAPGGVPAGATLSEQSGFKTKLQEESGAQYAADSRTAATYQDRVFPLQQAAKALETAKTGEGSDVLQSIASRIQTMTPDALKNIVPNFRTPDEIAAYDDARKYLSMAKSNRPGAGRSDAALATADTQSPSEHISPQAAKLLVQAQLGIERSKQALFLEFNATHPQGTEDQYIRWSADQGAKIDPRAFITDTQNPEQRKSYYARLGDKEQENYLSSYEMAKRHRLLTLPNGP